VAAVKNKEISKMGALTEGELAQVLSSLCKQRQESIEGFRKGGREELAAKESRELGILQTFLPPALSQEQVEKRVQEVIAELGVSGAKGMGPVMKKLREEMTGKVDGQLLSDTVRKFLSA
ncbi:MAG: GatB/YqeY domain-containing protein, partial [bacterium]|nr:GatB/YqeY domain-containing protein [bacterium]